MSVVIDDIWLKIAPFFKRPARAPECTDSELLAMTVIDECRGWGPETEMLSRWQEHRDLFPVTPTQSRFNRRRLLQAFYLIRRIPFKGWGPGSSMYRVYFATADVSFSFGAIRSMQQRLESIRLDLWESTLEETDHLRQQTPFVDCHEWCYPF